MLKYFEHVLPIRLDLGILFRPIPSHSLTVRSVALLTKAPEDSDRQMWYRLLVPEPTKHGCIFSPTCPAGQSPSPNHASAIVCFVWTIAGDAYFA